MVYEKGHDEADLFSNLRLVKKSQQSATKEIEFEFEFELHSFTQLIKDQILSEKQSTKGGDLEEISQYFFSGIL